MLLSETETQHHQPCIPQSATCIIPSPTLIFLYINTSIISFILSIQFIHSFSFQFTLLSFVSKLYGKMYSLPLLALLATATATATTKTLYAAHQPNALYTLSLTTNETNHDPAQSLAIASTKNTCGDLPGGLTLDQSSGVLYCSDGSSRSGHGNKTLSGSLTALSTSNGDEGSGLKELVKVQDVGAGVSSALYPMNDGEILAVAHEYVPLSLP